jgi:hypothetical protein
MSDGGLPPGALPLPQVGLSGPLPGAIADLDSIARDITFTRKCAAVYLATMPPSPGEHEAQAVARQALWFAGVISYRRAFTSGRGHLVAKGSRIQINEQWKEVLSPDQQRAHDKVYVMANQHVAHRVAEHEGVVVTAMLSPPPAQREVLTTGVMLAVMVGPEAGLPELLISICDVLLQLIGAESQRLQHLLLDKLKQEDIDLLYADATTPGTFPQPNHDVP